MKFKCFYLVLLILFCIGLLACSSNMPVVPTTTPVKTVDTTVTAYLNHHPDALQNLQANNIKLLHVGDNTRFVLPSADMFNGLGNRIQISFYPMLDQIIQIIQAVPKESITVQAYMFGNNSQTVALKLTNLQAEAVSNYLMSHGVDARLLYSIGMGNHNQVTQSPDRLLENYRVEITLEELRTRLPG